MKHLGLLRALAVALASFLSGCSAATYVACDGPGVAVSDGVSRFCVYGVVIGGFCPAGLPERIEVRSTPSDTSPCAVLCSATPLPQDRALTLARLGGACASVGLDGGTDAPAGDGDPCGGCGPGDYCALAPGCGGPPAYQCTRNTCGDASLVPWCGCDGRTLYSTAGACAPVSPTQRYARAGACPSDGGSPDADASRLPDAHPVDAQGTLSCGTLTCNAGEVCVLRCSGIDASGIELHSCVPIPARCADDVSCACFGATYCGGSAGGTCLESSDRHFSCNGCA